MFKKIKEIFLNIKCNNCNEKNDIINDLPVAYFEADNFANVQFANRRALKLLDADKLENSVDITNYNALDFVVPESTESARQNYYKKLNNELNEPTEYEVRTFLGDIKIFRIFTRPKDKNKNIIIFTDITTQKYYERRLEQMSYIDPLTNLFNRNAFNEKIKELENNPLNSLPVGIIICDINGLKYINDNLGHDQGDLVLKEFADILKTSCKDKDLVYRIGGDEFAIILTSTNIEVLKLIKDRISDIQKDVIKDDKCYTASISVGWAIRSESPLYIKDLFKEADDDMYGHKHNTVYNC